MCLSRTYLYEGSCHAAEVPRGALALLLHSQLHSKFQVPERTAILAMRNLHSVELSALTAIARQQQLWCGKNLKRGF